MAILTIDIGSSSTRIILFDNRYRQVTHSRFTKRYNFNRQADGAATIDPEFLRHTVEDLITKTVESRPKGDIQGVGISIFVGHILGINREGKPITPIITYADTRSQSAIRHLRSKLNKMDIHHQTGCRLHTSYLPAQLFWFRTTLPQQFQEVHRWIDFGAYLYMRWFGCGDVPMSYSVASWTGLLNRHYLNWDPSILEHTHIAHETLPRLADYNETLSGLKPAYYEKWPSLKSTPFLLAIGDGAAANIGSGCVAPSKIALTIGTTAALRIGSKDTVNKLPGSLWDYRISSGIHLVGGATSEGGNVFQWMSKQFSLNKTSDLETNIASRNADCHGLTMLPFFIGERSPGWNASATATIHGITLSTEKIDIVQAVLESVAIRLSLIEQDLVDLTDENSIIIAGGAAIQKSNIWAQIIANAMDREVRTLHDAETSAKGVAILARSVIEGIKTTPNASDEIDQIYSPQPEQVKRLHSARDRQTDLYHRLYNNINTV